MTAHHVLRASRPKELLWLWNAGHTEWMADDHPTFVKMISRFDNWFHTHVGQMAE